MTPLQTYFPLLVATLVAVGLGALLLVAAHVLAHPRRRGEAKESPFECGSEPVGSARERFGVKFYVIALLFILFDVEAVFIYPWAVQVRALGWPAYVAMLSFALTLVVGLAYVWKKGALEMESD